MSDLNVSAEWVEAEELQGPELRSTWCSLSINIGDACPTRVLSRRARTVRDEVFVPAYPFAEWLATSWWLLFEQRENPSRYSQRAFQETHGLRFARDGYALPDLSLASLGDACRLRWSAGPLDPYGVEFLSSGSVTLPTADVRSVFRDFVNQVVSRLTESGIEGTLLQDEWDAIQALDEEEVEYCVALASVGMDPFSVDDESAAAVIEAYQSLPEGLIRELSAVVEGTDLAPAAATVAAVLDELDTTETKLRGLTDLRAALQAGEAGRGAAPTPWALGYAEARALRAELGLNGAVIGSLDRLGELLGEEAEDIEQIAQGEELHLELVRGVVASDDQGALAMRLEPSHPGSTLFHFSRAVGGYLFGPDRATALTRASSDLQSQLRAFAAELLAPASSLREAVTSDRFDQDEVEELGAEFGVSPFVVHYQLYNHGIAQTPLDIVDAMPDA